MKNNYIDIKDLSDSREMLEAKFPKVITIFMVILLTVITTGLVWCYFGKIDTYAIAGGEIRTDKPSSSLSSLSTGKITEIFITDGEKVKENDTILTIDSEYYKNQKEVFEEQKEDRLNQIDDYRLLKQSIENDRNLFDNDDHLYYEYENYALELKETFESIDNANEQITNSMDEYDLIMSQNEKAKNDTNGQVREYRKLIDCINNKEAYTGKNQLVLYKYNTYLNYYSPLKSICDNLETKVSDGTATLEEVEQYNDALSSISDLNNSTIIEINKTISELNIQITNYDSNIDSYKLKKDALSYKDNKEDSKQKLKNSYYINIDNKIEALNNEILNIDNELSKLNETLETLSIKATNQGVLMYGKNYAIGDTITTSEIIASIIPEDSSYKVILLLPESKIAEVKIGQEVEYVISSISMTDYGKPRGKIESISADSFSEQTSGSKFYKVIASIENVSLTNKKDGQIRDLRVGMLVEGHIITGSQTIMSYILDKLNFK